MKGNALVVVAIVLGVVAVFLVNSRFGELEDKAHPKTTTFFRATADIIPAAGLTVKEAREGKQKLLKPVTSIPESFAKSYADALDEKELEMWDSTPIARPVRAGEFLRVSDLKPYSTAEKDAAVPEGHVRVAISVSQETAVGFQVAPGDVVDVYLTRQRTDPRAAGGQVAEAEVVVAEVGVYATGDLFLSGDPTAPRLRAKAYPTVTLMVKPEQASKLIAAQALGRLTLVLKTPRKPA